MKNRVQQKGEELSQYFYEKERLCRLLDLDTADIKEQILIGLLSKDQFNAMSTKYHNSIDELFHDLITFEEMNRQRYERFSHYKVNVDISKQTELELQVQEMNSQFNEKSQITGAELKCYNCHKMGHFSKNCSEPKRDLVCIKCNAIGHTQKYCTSETEMKQITLLQIDQDINNDKQAKKYYKKGLIDNFELFCFIDSGSSDCTIRAFAVLSKKFNIIRAPVQLKSFGPKNYKIFSPGFIKATIEIDNVVVNIVILHIVPDDVQSTDVLIGRSFTDAPGVNHYKEGDLFKFTMSSNVSMNSFKEDEEASQITVSKDVTLKSKTLN